MPELAHYVVRAGSTPQKFLLLARDRAGAPKRGLRASAPGATAAYVRAGEASARDLPLSEGNFREVDAQLAPGAYELTLPAEVLAEGSTQVVVCLQFPEAVIAPIELALVAYDSREPERIGMICLEWEMRWEFLRQGLPRLAEMELQLRNEGTTK